ncbi:MAG: hypothetical protein OXE76_03960 [Alphaproteobacteria bacterium]|nr:hypothetical protein [Alphaproteobacteria bacterium]
MGELFPDRDRPHRTITVNGRAPAVSDEQPKTPGGLQACLDALGYTIRYNVRNSRPEVRAPGTETWQGMTDRIAARIRAEEIPARFTEAGSNKTLNFRSTIWEDCLNARLSHVEVDPFLQWLESLKWNGESRLQWSSPWLAHIFDIAPEHLALAAWIGRFLVLGAVWRAYKPGTKLDEMPVLIGHKQGDGKSTMLAHLFPEEYRDTWFDDGLRFSADDKTRAEALQGRVIVEASEMVGSTRAERESIKAFVSRTNDGAVRLAYRRNPEPLPRRCIIAGTSNDPHCLPADPSGNRRFVPITVKAGPDGMAGVRMYLREFREQLWAEAVHLYRQGETAWLPESLARDQKKATDAAVSVDETLEDAVASFLATREGKAFRAAECLHHVEAKFGQARRLPSTKGLAVELQRLGCEPMGLKSVQGKKMRLWRPPSIG